MSQQKWLVTKAPLGGNYMPRSPLNPPQLPAPVAQVLGDFLRAAQTSFADRLVSVVLYGSAAEGTLRATSDVNLVLVLTAFEQADAEQLREPLRVAQAAVQLRPMFLLGEEIPAATRFFAPKFADILRRRAILFGPDPFANTSIARESEIRQLKQQLLNIAIRLRSAYVNRGLREEQLAFVIANFIGPLRSYTATVLELEGCPASSPQEALSRLGVALGLPDWDNTLEIIASIQEARLSEPGAAGRIVFELLEYARRMFRRVEALVSEVGP
ncbi:MAG: nucleotidyltransferase domain-containing protein [Candidatus Acidiferrum sp.]|jgi:predicted nucleotidyltransferase